MGIVLSAVSHENCQKSAKISEFSIYNRWQYRDFGYESGQKDSKNGAKASEMEKY